jgi:hypothetical protein
VSIEMVSLSAPVPTRDSTLPTIRSLGSSIKDSDLVDDDSSSSSSSAAAAAVAHVPAPAPAPEPAAPAPVTFSNIDAEERAVSRIIDLALVDATLTTAEALQEVRFAFAQLIRLRDEGSAPSCCPPQCCERLGQCMSLRFELASAFPGHTTRPGSYALWIITLLAAVALIAIGAIAQEEVFGRIAADTDTTTDAAASASCLDCDSVACAVGLGGGVAGLGDGVCSEAFNCAFWDFDGGDCDAAAAADNLASNASNSNGDGAGDVVVVDYRGLALSCLVLGCALATFALTCCCCCRCNWQCKPGVRRWGRKRRDYVECYSCVCECV